MVGLLRGTRFLEAGMSIQSQIDLPHFTPQEYFLKALLHQRSNEATTSTCGV